MMRPEGGILCSCPTPLPCVLLPVPVVHAYAACAALVSQLRLQSSMVAEARCSMMVEQRARFEDEIARLKHSQVRLTDPDPLLVTLILTLTFTLT